MHVSFIETPRKIFWNENDLLIKYLHAENFRRYHRARYKKVQKKVFDTIYEKTPKEVIHVTD